MKDNCRCTNAYFHNKPQLKLESQTTNKATFKAYPIPRQPELPQTKVVQKSYDPEVLHTSYKSTFTKPTPIKEPTDAVDSLSKHMLNKPQNVPFYSDTSYKQSFPKHEVKPLKQPTYQYKPKQTKFEGESSYKSTFVQKKNPEFYKSQELVTLNDYMGRKAKVAFEGRTSYNDTFTNPGVKQQKQPEYKYQPKATKFEGESSYKMTFKPLPRQAYGSEIEYCPVHPSKVAIK